LNGFFVTIVLQAMVNSLLFAHYRCEVAAIQKGDCKAFRKEQSLLIVIWTIAMLALLQVPDFANQLQNLSGLTILVNFGAVCFTWAPAKAILMYKACQNARAA
jgi:hypothetical protein